MKQYSNYYPLSSFPNNAFNLKRLENQIKGYYRDMWVRPYGGGVLIFDKVVIPQEKIAILDQVVSSHTGKELVFLNKKYSDERRLNLQSLLAMAYDRADLNPIFPLFQKYFNYINKELDGYIYYGAAAALKERILADKEVGQPFEAILNGVVTDGLDGEPDILAYQFLISSIDERVEI